MPGPVSATVAYRLPGLKKKARLLHGFLLKHDNGVLNQIDEHFAEAILDPL
jgi:hypothetical protein